jgi:hypothetical protein
MNLWVKMQQLDARVRGREAPLDCPGVVVALLLPRLDLGLQQLLLRDATVGALAA